MEMKLPDFLLRPERPSFKWKQRIPFSLELPECLKQMIHMQLTSSDTARVESAAAFLEIEAAAAAAHAQGVTV
ncbi:hypothetical protein CRG98_019339 [Punica granatum]|uniref:Uncharacterized protein n=1 Tax=Punica granatum TaxID=22663 RepID=A0A2I0JVD7_PUNGR|nr:hypothetical protein CRG98_019339 [Punica granatum]